MLKKVWSYPVDFCITFRTIPDNPTSYIESASALSDTWTPTQFTLPCSLACAGNKATIIPWLCIKSHAI